MSKLPCEGQQRSNEGHQKKQELRRHRNELIYINEKHNSMANRF